MSLIADTLNVYTGLLSWPWESAAPDVRERFGDAVRGRREELGLTQEDLAGKAGIHRTYLSDVERGGRNPSLVNIEKLARALAVSMSVHFDRVERPKPPAPTGAPP